VDDDRPELFSRLQNRGNRGREQPVRILHIEADKGKVLWIAEAVILDRMDGCTGKTVSRSDYSGKGMLGPVDDQTFHGGITGVQIVQPLLDQLIINFQIMLCHGFDEAVTAVSCGAFLCISTDESDLFMSQTDQMINGNFSRLDIVQQHDVALQIVRLIVEKNHGDIVRLIGFDPLEFL